MNPHMNLSLLSIDTFISMYLPHEFILFPDMQGPGHIKTIICCCFMNCTICSLLDVISHNSFLKPEREPEISNEINLYRILINDMCNI